MRDLEEKKAHPEYSIDLALLRKLLRRLRLISCIANPCAGTDSRLSIRIRAIRPAAAGFPTGCRTDFKPFIPGDPFQ
jgi:hypothetical protein